MKRFILLIALVASAAGSIFYLTGMSSTLRPQSSEDYNFDVHTLRDGLTHPWSLAFLPDGQMLVTERPGRLLLLSQDAAEQSIITGLPPIADRGQGGLLDIRLHPDFTENRLVYFSYAANGPGGVGTEVARARLVGNQLLDVETIFQLRPKSDSGRHFGSRLVFDNNHRLYITLGDRGDRPRAQKLDDHAGSVIRIHDDGSIPKDNPFTGQSGKTPEIYSYGHRNIQGAALHPDTGQLWTQEHGPQGGDEVNAVRPSLNYGWPVITYGVNYGSGTPIGEGTHKEGMEQPLYTWVPSIAPSGMLFYTGELFPKWRGDLFIGALKDKMLVRLELDGNTIVKEERLLKNVLGRIRDVRQGPDGLIYLLTDHDNGKLVRLSPQ